MAQVRRSLVLRAPSAEVWEVLADYGSLSEWADGVDHSCLLHHPDDGEVSGMVRRVQAGRDTFVETVTAYEPPHVLAYDIAGVPRGFSVSNRWNLHTHTEDTTTVTLTSTVIMTPHPLRLIAERALARLMAKRSEGLLDSLARRLTGELTRATERSHGI